MKTVVNMSISCILLVLIASATAIILPENPPDEHSGCVDDCTGLPNGDYQSCQTCNGYVTCDDNSLIRQLCPESLIWEDVLKRCERTSSTCRTRVVVPYGIPSQDYLGCVDDCTGQSNGDYQSCRTCNGYVTCDDNSLIRKPCPESLIWEDVLKRCERTSSTCRTRVVVPYFGSGDSDVYPCVDDCFGSNDGDYQSCETCRGYVSCSGGVLTNRPCPENLLWDDSLKRCEYTSATCDVQESPETPIMPPSPSPTPKARCNQGWDFFQNNCYAFVTEKVNFMEALLSCAFDYSAELVKIRNNIEHQFLIDVIYARYSNTTGQFWTAANAIATSADNPKWTLAPEGEPATYLNWGQNEPNNAKNGRPELCVNLLKNRGYLFNDSNCKRRWAYICKAPARSY